MEDITYRAVRLLSEVDLIAAEDTRTSKKLLDRYKIDTPMTSYHEHNKLDKAKTLIDKLLDNQDIALITDAGTPGISDPGEELVAMCYDNDIDVMSIPGPAAFVTAVTSSGLTCRRIAFEAFLPKDKKYRVHVLEEISKESRTIVIYESPHHLKATLKDLGNVLEYERPLTVTRELTKLHEEIVEGTAAEMRDEFAGRDKVLGEFAVFISGIKKAQLSEEKADN